MIQDDRKGNVIKRKLSIGLIARLNDIAGRPGRVQSCAETASAFWRDHVIPNNLNESP